ncbi:MAG: hypothetical protein IT455_12480 [Planctomycetes bacterium]|nr:hypothetical protein [Planctomycetota bacterium]
MQDARRSWLEAIGYRVTFRHAGWVECLLTCDGERWFGTGHDDAEAFAHALQQAMPSAAARRAFEVACAEVSDPPAPAAAPTPILAEPDTTAAGEVEPPAAAPAPAPAPSAAVLAGDSTPPAMPAPPAPLPPPIEREVMTVAEAHAELDELQQAIRDTYVEASLLTPARQRLLLTQWMARGRAIDEAVLHEGSVTSRVYQLSQDLGKLAKVWWPGAVQVLALRTSPWGCARDCDADVAANLRTWRDVEEAASISLDRLEADDDAAPDDFGWCDRAALQPRTPDPGETFASICAALEAHSHPPLMRPHSAVHTDDLRPTLVEPTTPLKPGQWEELAARLRWLRCCIVDPELWGAAMGRFRWLAQVYPPAKSAAPLLDATFRPLGTWRLHLGLDQRELEHRRDQVLVRVPPATANDDELRTWLLETFELGTALTSEQLAPHVQHLRARIVALPDDTLSERKQRRRLRHLKDALRQGMPATPSPIAVAAPKLTTAAPPEPAPPTADELRAARLRPFTVGKRVLFVSNRHDPDRNQRLLDLLGFASIDSCVAEPSRVDAKAGSVRNGTYQLVLAATGFLPHKVDNSLKEACRACDVPYVRVNRGRPQQCLLHLARELGIDSPTQA